MTRTHRRTDGPDRVVISWIDRHARSDAIAVALGAEPVFMPWARPRLAAHRRALSWLRSAVRTARTARRVAPGGTIVVMAPPVFAPAVVRLFAPRDVAIVVDVHSGALNDERWRWSFPWMARLLRASDLALVTNLELVAGVDTGRTPIAVCHDPLVRDRDGAAGPPTRHRPFVVFPASGADDEPVAEVVRAAALLDDVEIHVTGRVPLSSHGSLVLTGYLEPAAYDDTLRRASAVLALTTREATAQRAAYDALEHRRPIVASSTRALREILGSAAVFVENEGASIASGVREALAHSAQLIEAGDACAARLSDATALALERVAAVRSRRQRHRSASSAGS